MSPETRSALRAALVAAMRAEMSAYPAGRTATLQRLAESRADAALHVVADALDEAAEHARTEYRRGWEDAIAARDEVIEAAKAWRAWMPGRPGQLTGYSPPVSALIEAVDRLAAITQEERSDG